MATTTSLEETIIYTLAEKGPLKADLLHTHVQALSPCTIQWMYKKLNLLVDRNIIIKHDLTYSISISWIKNLKQFTEKASSQYLAPEYLETILPTEDGDKQSWTCSSQFKINTLWDQVMTAMAHNTKTGIALSYCPHQWYDIIWENANERFLNSFHKHITHDYILVGANTPLDQYAREMVEKRPQISCHNLTMKDPLSKNRCTSACVIDDYILLLTVPQQLAQKIDALYMHNIRKEDIQTDNVIELINQPHKVRLTLKKDRKLAQKYWKKFTQIFGPLGK